MHTENRYRSFLCIVLRFFFDHGKAFSAAARADQIKLPISVIIAFQQFPAAKAAFTAAALIIRIDPAPHSSPLTITAALLFPTVRTALKSKTHPSAPTRKLPISRAAKPPFAIANVPLLRSGDVLRTSAASPLTPHHQHNCLPHLLQASALNAKISVQDTQTIKRSPTLYNMPSPFPFILIENHIVDNILQGLQYDFQLHPKH